MDDSHKTLSNAFFQTVAYADIFDHPLTAREIHRYLTGLQISFENLNRALESQAGLARIGEYYILPGREEIIPIRKQREARSRALLPRALRYGRILGSLPFIRMVALTGSLAVLNVSKTDDYDYLLVTVPGRVWTARAFALLFNRVVRLFGHTICPNLIISENALEWPMHDLYSARELCQMIPISRLDVYHKLMGSNAWAGEFLPNAFVSSDSLPVDHGPEQPPPLQRFMEFLLRGNLGDRFEEWEMKRKIARFSKRQGFGEETLFNADVCQGNFHHHRRWTREVYENKLSALGILPGGEIPDAKSPGTRTGEYIL